jgi:hypothetical protein
MRVVCQTVQDGISDDGVREQAVPNRSLSGCW